MSADLRDQLQASLGAAYVIERELGGGGMSRVFVAEEVRFKRRVVIKVLSPNLAAGLSIERFEREIELAAALQQANIVPVITAGEVDGLPWYSMPYVDGESLRVRCRPELREGPALLPFSECIKILGDIARALAYAHGRGIVHRDIKPENVLLSGGTAVVTDFGIAKALTASRTKAPGGTLTQIGTSLGTPAYMAPEQAAGDEVDHRADLYAWGVIAYELLGGKHPFSARKTAQQLIAAHIAETPPHLSTIARTIPRTMANLVMECLAKDPAARPADAEHILGRLNDAHVQRSGGGRHRSRWIRAAAVVMLLAIVATAWRMAGGPKTPLLEPQRVVVATFTNRTGDASLDPIGLMAADWIARGLSNTGLVDVAGTAADLAARDASSKENQFQSLGTLARLAKAGIVISGSYYRQGDSIYFDAYFTNANARRRAQSVGAVSGPFTRPLDGVERLRQRVTASLASMLDPRLGPLSASTNQPPNMEAYREFLEGENLFYTENTGASLTHYSRAAALDSSYVYPLLRSMTVLSNLRRYAEVDSIGRYLLRHADQLSPFERAYIETSMAAAHGNPQGMYDGTRALIQAAPKSDFAAFFHALGAMRVGRYLYADSIMSKLDPEGGELRGRTTFCYNHTLVLHALGDVDRMMSEGARACRQHAGRSYALFPQILAFAMLGKERELRPLIEQLLQLPTDRTISPEALAAYAAIELDVHGHREEGKRLAARIVAWHDSTQVMTDLHRPLGRIIAFIAAGEWRRALSLVDAMAADSTVATRQAVQGIQGMQGYLHAMAGDTVFAKTVSARLALGATPFDRRTVSEARAAIAAALGDKAGATAILRESYPVGFRDDQFHFRILPLYQLLHGYAPFDAMLRLVP